MCMTILKSDFSIESAAACALDYLRKHGPASSEALTDACKDMGHVPHDDRAFGAVYQRLSREGRIKRHGICQRRKGHSTSGGNIWAACG